MSVRTQDLLERLATWQQLGFITDEQAAAIAEHERRTGGASPPERRRDRTTAAEAVGYVGAALVLGALGAFLGQFWEDLTTGGQLVLALLTTVVLAAAAAALRRATSATLARLTSVLLLGVVSGVAWSTFVLTEGLLGWSDDDVALAVAVGTVAAALPLYLLRRRALPQLTLLAALHGVIGALLIRPDLSLDAFWYALPFAALGAVWVLLGEGGYLPPRTVAATSGAIVALIALQCAAFGDQRVAVLVLAIAVAAALVVAAVVVGGVHHLGVGAVGLFVTVPQLVFELFGDVIGAPATLLLAGILLVLLAVGLGRARHEVSTTGGAP